MVGDRGVRFDGGAEGTKRVQSVVETELGGDRQDVGLGAGVEGTKRMQDVGCEGAQGRSLRCSGR